MSLSEAPAVSPRPFRLFPSCTEDAGERKNYVITSVTVLSYEAMRERARDHGIPANAFVVSIVDPEEEPIFEQDTDRIITLRFHDLDPQWPVDPERDPRPSYVFMNAEQARQIVDHVLKFHQHPEPWELLVNCMQGISRSGAVGTFVQRVAGIPAEQFLTQNTGLHPNGYVLKLLAREWTRRRGRGWSRRMSRA